MTEKIQFKAANPPKTMKYDHFAHSALVPGHENLGIGHVQAWQMYAH